MPKAFVVDRCMFCGELPCVCEKSKSRHPTKVQNTKRSAGPQTLDQAAPDEQQEPETPAPAESSITEPPKQAARPAPVKKQAPTGKSLSSLSTRTPPQDDKPVAVVPAGEVISFAEVQVSNHDAEFERAIGVLRDAGLLHPSEPYSSPEQRAARWRAEQWRRRHGMAR